MPVATRDRRHIAFWSDRDGRPQIYSMKADGSDVRRITDSPRTDLGADWSPDGQWLVFASYAEGSDLGEIVRIQANGTDRRTLVRSKDARWPRVSSDGKKIAFTQEDEHGVDGVYVMNADGSNLEAFPTGLEKAGSRPGHPMDGTSSSASLPPTARSRDRQNRVYVAELSGANRRLVATVPGVLQIPRWSPDGRKVAYQVRGPRLARRAHPPHRRCLWRDAYPDPSRPSLPRRDALLAARRKRSLPEHPGRGLRDLPHER